MSETGRLPPGLGPVALLLPVIALAGGALLAVGLTYTLVRQVRRRRTLPPDRYRGPSVVLQLALALVLVVAATTPLATDAEGLVSGRGPVSLLGAVVIVTSTQLALLLISWAFVFRTRAVAFAEPLLGRLPLHALRVGFGWGLLAWLVASAVGVLVVLLMELAGLESQPEPVTQRVIGTIDPWLAVLGVVIIAPVAEEAFFRGVAFNAWLRERGRRFAYIGSSLLFAAIHASIVSLAPIFLLGLALAWVYRRTGSLLAPIAMHATVNGITVGLGFLVRYEVIRPPA